MHEIETLAQRHPDVIGEFEGCCSGATFCAIDDDEIRTGFRFEHRLADGEEFPRLTDTKLETSRFAVGKAPHLCYEMHHLDGR